MRNCTIEVELDRLDDSDHEPASLVEDAAVIVALQAGAFLRLARSMIFVLFVRREASRFAVFAGHGVDGDVVLEKRAGLESVDEDFVPLCDGDACAVAADGDGVFA